MVESDREQLHFLFSLTAPLSNQEKKVSLSNNKGVLAKLDGKEFNISQRPNQGHHKWHKRHKRAP